MFALALKSPLVGTAMGGLCAFALLVLFLALLWRSAMQALDATNGIRPEDEAPRKKTDSQSDV